MIRTHILLKFGRVGWCYCRLLFLVFFSLFFLSFRIEAYFLCRTKGRCLKRDSLRFILHRACCTVCRLINPLFFVQINERKYRVKKELLIEPGGNGTLIEFIIEALRLIWTRLKSFKSSFCPRDSLDPPVQAGLTGRVSIMRCIKLKLSFVHRQGRGREMNQLGAIWNSNHLGHRKHNRAFSTFFAQTHANRTEVKPFKSNCIPFQKTLLIAIIENVSASSNTMLRNNLQVNT